jgi:hypothetical protein
MADEIITAEEQTAPELTPEQVSFEQQMAYQFSDEVAVSEQPQVETVQSDTAAQPPATAQTGAAVAPVVDYLKELGYDTIDAAKDEINELRKLKAELPTPKEIEFANEESKKIHELLREGKVKEVKQYLDTQEMLSNLDGMSDEQRLKLHIKLQNPKFDQELVDDEYNELYSIDEEEDDYIDDPNKLRKAKLRIEQRIENDVQKANEYFSKFKQNAELPDITPKAKVDEEYEGWKASNAASKKFHSEVLVPSIMSLTEDALKMSFDINDTNNQMQFGVSITPEKADLEVAKKGATDLFDYIASKCYDKDGNVIPTALSNIILRNEYFEKYAQSIARQAVNAERLRVVETEKGVSGTRMDTTPVVEKSEFQKQMEYALS